MLDFETAACLFRKEALLSAGWGAQTNTPIPTDDKYEETGCDYLQNIKRTIDRQHPLY